MKRDYEAPSMEIDWFESSEGIATVSDVNSGTDYIPGTHSDDAFDL